MDKSYISPLPGTVFAAQAKYDYQYSLDNLPPTVLNSVPAYTLSLTRILPYSHTLPSATIFYGFKLEQQENKPIITKFTIFVDYLGVEISVAQVISYNITVVECELLLNG